MPFTGTEIDDIEIQSLAEALPLIPQYSKKKVPITISLKGTVLL
jgi:hypothetical protein